MCPQGAPGVFLGFLWGDIGSPIIENVARTNTGASILRSQLFDTGGPKEPPGAPQGASGGLRAFQGGIFWILVPYIDLPGAPLEDLGGSKMQFRAPEAKKRRSWSVLDFRSCSGPTQRGLRRVPV